ncbi:hypothetical protein [Streptomyces sp. NPDC002057]|uniref:hypothetical protein n=1 Tax=Streptomyces sp. NPDC002057 TaxID=3154664 RepID=UPI00332B9F1B
MTTPVVDIWGPAAPEARAEISSSPEPHDEWELPGGKAWIFYRPLNRRQLIRPVILSDGFSGGPSSLDRLWAGLEENGDYRFISELHATGRDVVILGYDDRAASITANADTAIDCIRRALAERVSDCIQGVAPVGGAVDGDRTLLVRLGK